MQEADYTIRTWPAGVVQWLDEHHLVLVADSARERRHLAAILADSLRCLDHADVVVIHGSLAPDLASFCSQLESHYALRDPMEHSIPGLLQFFRSASPSIRRRYLIWLDADVMLREDIALFGRIVNCLCGVAIEHEYIDSEAVQIQRTVFLGGASLARYAAYEHGQFRTWLRDDPDQQTLHSAIDVFASPPLVIAHADQ